MKKNIFIKGYTTLPTINEIFAEILRSAKIDPCGEFFFKWGDREISPSSEYTVTCTEERFSALQDNSIVFIHYVVDIIER